MDKRIIPPAHRYYGLRQWTRHSLVLVIAGFVYIGIGVAYSVQKTFGETVSAVQLATEFLPFQFWGILWGIVGVLAIISSRWPPVSRSWGYMALTAMASGWAALYVVGVVVNGAPVYQLNGALAWGLLAFLWWVISGLVAPEEVE